MREFRLTNVSLCLGLCLFLAGTAQGQLRRVLHQSIPADSVAILHLTITDSTTVQTWHNSAIFIESAVSLAHCQEGIFRHVIDKGRYALNAQREGSTMTLVQAVPERAHLTSPQGPCDETIVHRIYIPRGFEAMADGTWQRTTEINRSTLNR